MDDHDYVRGLKPQILCAKKMLSRGKLKCQIENSSQESHAHYVQSRKSINPVIQLCVQWSRQKLYGIHFIPFF